MVKQIFDFVCFIIYMVSVQNNHIYPYFRTNVPEIKQEPVNITVPNFRAVSEKRSLPGFESASQNMTTRTVLTQYEVPRYNQVASVLDKKDRKNLALALKSGVLLKSSSEDRTTVLDNLYKIVTLPRLEGLTPETVARDVLNTVVNPAIITQKFGDIPKEVRPQVLDYMTGGIADERERNRQERELDEMYSGCCVAASVEFNLAHRHPAEFARFVEGLTSPAMEVKKTIDLEELSKNTVDAVWLLDAFEVPYELLDLNKAVLTLKPDKEAVIRARIQNYYRDKLERSSIDVLMQSTLMQLGTEQTYSSLLDKRGGKFSNEDKGLIDFEKTFIESVVKNQDTTSVVYQTVDENQRVVGQEADYVTIKKQILEALSMGENVIIGYLLTDSTGMIENAHEITIIDSRKTSTGETIFICNDTDDDVPYPIEYSESYLIPKIHHAGLPTAVAEKNMELTDNWQILMRDFNELQKDKKNIV